MSTREQVATPPVQREAIEKLCEEKGWELVGVFEDHGVSGFTDALQRPGFRKAVEALREKGGGVLVAWSLDRITRRGVAYLTRLVAQLFQHNILLFTVRERWLFEDAYRGGALHAKLAIELLASIAEAERELIRARTREAMANPEVRARMEEGLRRFYEEVLGVRTVGWEEEAVRLYKQGWSITKIAEKLGVSKYRVYRYLVQIGLHKPVHTAKTCPRCLRRMDLVEDIPPRWYCRYCGYEEVARI